MLEKSTEVITEYIENANTILKTCPYDLEDIEIKCVFKSVTTRGLFKTVDSLVDNPISRAYTSKSKLVQEMITGTASETTWQTSVDFRIFCSKITQVGQLAVQSIRDCVIHMVHLESMRGIAADEAVLNLTQALQYVLDMQVDTLTEFNRISDKLRQHVTI